jgi:hypothetical protein
MKYSVCMLVLLLPVSWQAWEGLQRDACAVLHAATVTTDVSSLAGAAPGRLNVCQACLCTTHL